MLSKTEADLLKCMLTHRGGCDRATLLQDVLGYHPEAVTNTLETHIWRIRRKIEASPGEPRILKTTGTGYQLVVDQYATGSDEWLAYLRHISDTCPSVRDIVASDKPGR
ncbi:helix-turn-helix domain-containing protein [uncultured Roseobacter sp.]|uniref:winged helix-turn-helix domain-containing protein n=1 Tax=uncultured Roseobacter sp. TaxID=114847 RepID=UPI002639B36B|nr:helix-turn-helix domain-containing protein [uncultured Roseobacter sp.]